MNRTHSFITNHTSRSMMLLVLCAILGMVFGGPLGASAMPPNTNLTISRDATVFIQEVAKEFETKNPHHQTKIINDFVDVLIDEVKKYIQSNHLDPSNLPDLHEEFTYKTLFVKSHGEVNLTHGQFWNISSVHRGGEATLYKNSSSSLTISIPVWFNNLMFEYSYSAHLMGMTRVGELYGTLKEFQIRAVIEVDYERLMLKLEDLKVDKTGKPRIKFRGHVWTDWIANTISSVVTRVFKGFIDKKVEGIVRDALEKAIDRVNHIFGDVRPNVINQ